MAEEVTLALTVEEAEAVEEAINTRCDNFESVGLEIDVELGILRKLRAALSQDSA